MSDAAVSLAHPEEDVEAHEVMCEEMKSKYFWILPFFNFHILNGSEGFLHTEIASNEKQELSLHCIAAQL